MNENIRWRRVVTGIAGAGIALLLLSGCAGTDNDASSSSAEDAPAADAAAPYPGEEAAKAGPSDDGDTDTATDRGTGTATDRGTGTEPGTGTNTGGAGSTGSGTGTPAPAPAPAAGTDSRSIVYKGSMSVKVDEVAAAANRAVDIAVGAGGYVGADTRTSYDSQSEARLTLRIPADAFSATLDALAKLGDEESRSISTADVTEAVIDLDARIVSQRASVNRVRALLAKARTIGEVVSIESELTRREADLASLQARKRDLAGQVALSTITVNLHDRPTLVTEPQAPRTGFVAGLASGWHAFVISVRVVLTVTGALLPFLILLSIPTSSVIWLARRRRRTRTAPQGPVGRDAQA